jgi:predicted transcriptional regulator
MKKTLGKNPLVQVVTNIRYSDYLKIMRIVEKTKKTKSSVVRDAILEYVNKR